MSYYAFYQLEYDFLSLFRTFSRNLGYLYLWLNATIEFIFWSYRLEIKMINLLDVNYNIFTYSLMSGTISAVRAKKEVSPKVNHTNITISKSTPFLIRKHHLDDS